MITLESDFPDDPFGVGDHPGAIPLPPLEPMRFAESENLTVRMLGETEGAQDVKMSIVTPLDFWERPGVGSWKLWRWRPWLRFQEDTWEFDAIVKDDGAGNQTLSVLGMVTATVTFHRDHPGDNV